MIQKRIISIFLLSLLLLVNWHNTFFHSHIDFEKEEYAAVHQHSHEHHHSDHHHDQNISLLWDWIQQVLEDFGHSDLGDNHLELFLGSYNQIGLDNSLAVVSNPFTFLPPHLLQSLDCGIPQKYYTPLEAPSYYDPSFLDAVGNRGPPIFS